MRLRLAALLATRIRERYGLPEDETLRLAVLPSDDEAGTAYAATFLDVLEWNGKSGIEAFGDGEIRQYAYTDDAESEIAADLLE